MISTFILLIAYSDGRMEYSGPWADPIECAFVMDETIPDLREHADSGANAWCIPEIGATEPLVSPLAPETSIRPMRRPE